jgi:Xaa-Pro aminopeptidase
MLDPRLSRLRQKRLLDHLSNRLDAIVVGQRRHVYYLAAWMGGHPTHESAMILFSDGRSWLATPNSPASPEKVAADELIAFEANWLGTQRQEQAAVVAEKVIEALRARGANRIGIDASAVTSQLASAWQSGGGSLEAIDPHLWQLRRLKDPDEIANIRIAMRAVEAMYARAKQIIEPGVEELHVFNELHAAAVQSTGEPMTAHLGNDFACGAGGGLPRKGRAAKAGEIYILDLGPTYRGYFADASRAFAVDRKPTDAQLKAWQAVTSCFDIVERMAKPSVRGRDLYRAVDEHLKLARGGGSGGGMPHHLGHGIGLQAHEFPHLNPKWDDVLEEGETFTAEPGQYGPELAAGIRIENAYLVTKSGVERLINFPMELT